MELMWGWYRTDAGFYGRQQHRQCRGSGETLSSVACRVAGGAGREQTPSPSLRPGLGVHFVWAPVTAQERRGSFRRCAFPLSPPKSS